MKSSIVVASLVITAFVASCGCGDLCSCSRDDECGAGQTCDRTNGTCVGSGEGEGEGEGVGDVSSCGDLDIGLGAGGGTVTATDANLTANGALCDCAAAGGDCFDLDVSIAGAAASDVDNADWIRFSANATGDGAVYASTSCNGSAVACVDAAGDLACKCGLCLTAGEPTDLAVKVHTAVGDSNGVCVNLQ